MNFGILYIVNSRRNRMDQKIIANIKALGIDIIQHAKSGHSGIVLSAAPIIYTVYAKHLCISTSDDTWINRDRFILSAGHGSALLYATLFLAGYDLSLDDLKQFRRLNSKTPGHPEYGKTPGVDFTTGPLGQGLASAVGMAIGEKQLEAKLTFPRQKRWEAIRSLLDYHIYVLCGDGDLMEGISYEACSLAGTLQLGHLIVLYDSNHMSLDGTTSGVFDEKVRDRFAAMGWHTEYVKNGEDVKAIDRAITRAKRSDKPSFIEIKTILGSGSLLEGTKSVHGSVLTEEDITHVKRILNIPNVPFYIDEEAREGFRKQITERSNEKYEQWAKNYREFTSIDENKKYQYLFQKSQPISILNLPFDLKPESKNNVREINHFVMNELAKYIPNWIGGNADLSASTKVFLEGKGIYSKADPTGKNILFGVREHAMGAILNGLALTHFRPFGTTYLSFADYLKPAIRMSALMGLPVTYIFTHDSIAVGQDGPTHQPIEQLTMLRATPNFYVFRPADGHELIGCWDMILQLQNTPSALILSRNETNLLDTTNAELVKQGAYIVYQDSEGLDAILIATGSEVHTAVNLARDLQDQLHLGVVSMPCQELFFNQPKEVQEQILPPGYKKIVIEAGSSFSWNSFVYNENYLFTVDQFGASGSKDEVLKYCQMDYESIKKRILELLK